MSGEEPKGAAGAHMVIGEELAKAMSKGGNKVVNRTEDIRNLSAEERGDTLTKAIGQRFGVPYVCVVGIKEVSGNSYYLNARMVNTETDETINTATAASNLSNSGEMADVAQVIARELAGGIAFAETAPQVQEAIPVQQAQQAQEAMPELKDFTVSQRVGTCGINFFLPGVGSLAIMRDWNGAITQWSLFGGGIILLNVGLATHNDAIAIIGGVVAYGSVLIYNPVRSITYKKKMPANMAFLENTNLNVAVLPDKDGNLKGYLLYSMEF